MLLSVSKIYLDTTREAELVNSLQSHNPKPLDSGRNMTAKQKICIGAETIAVKLCFSAPWDCQDLAPGKVLQLGQPKAYDNLPLWMTVIACWQFQGWHSCPGKKLWVIHYMFAQCPKFWCSLVNGVWLTNSRAAIMVEYCSSMHVREGCMHSSSAVSTQLTWQGSG